MKKRKMIAMALATMMAVSVVPTAMPVVALDNVIQPQSVPEVGNQIYVESVSAPTETNMKSLSNHMAETLPADADANENWYRASGVLFSIKPTNEGEWKRPELVGVDEKDPYFFFSVLALAEQKVSAYSSSGTKLEDNYATFWTNATFCGNKGRADSANPRVSEEQGMMYYSEDNGLTWKSLPANIGDGLYQFNLADVKAGEVLIYIPMAEFFYYGGYNGATGTTLPGANGVTSAKKGFTTFGHGIETLKNSNAEEGAKLHSLILSCKRADQVSGGAVGAASAVTASDLRLVYPVFDGTKTVKNGDEYLMEIYTNEPASVTDASVKAKIDDREVVLTGAASGDGRTKYVLDGLTASDVGKLVVFTWSSQSTGSTLLLRDTVKKGGSLQTLPSELDTSSADHTESPLWGANAVWAGDSLLAAARDSAAGGWAGRVASAYSMSSQNYAIGGRQISNFVGRGNAPFIANQIDQHITALTAKEREAVQYVIINGGINDINRDGVQMGVMTDDFDGFDVRTYAGALEHTFSVARRAYPNATVGFLILFKMPLAVQAGPAKCRDEALMRQYIDLTIAICEKWNVPYLNMYDDAAFNELVQTNNPETPYMDRADMLHLNKGGYIATMPYIAAWMATLEQQYVHVEQVLDTVSVGITEGAQVSVYAADVKEAPDAKMTVSVAGGEPITLEGVKQRGRVQYVCPVEPWQFGDELTFTWSSEALEMTQTVKTSVRAYCEYLFSTSGDAELVSLAKAMLHYGAAVQKLMNYKTDTLCNEGIEPLAPETLADADIPYKNPNDKVWTGAEIVPAPTPTLRLTVATPIPNVDYVVYRVSGRLYSSGEYERAELVDGVAEIPLGAHELGRDVNVRIFDGLGAWKEVYKISGFHCLNEAQMDDLMQAAINYAKLADAYAR